MSHEDGQLKADSFPLALLIGLLAISGGALAVLLTVRKRGKK